MHPAQSVRGVPQALQFFLGEIVLAAIPEGHGVDAEVVVSELLGSETMLYLKLGQTEFAARVDARDFHEPGEKVSLTFNVAKGHFFDAETEAAIR